MVQTPVASLGTHTGAQVSAPGSLYSSSAIGPQSAARSYARRVQCTGPLKDLDHNYLANVLVHLGILFKYLVPYYLQLLQ